MTYTETNVDLQALLDQTPAYDDAAANAAVAAVRAQHEITPILEPARAGNSTEIRYSHITHGYHLFNAAGEMIGNPYGYDSYLQAERADNGCCLTCGKPSPDPICPDCVTTSHRCALGHALEDDGSCITCTEARYASA